MGIAVAFGALASHAAPGALSLNGLARGVTMGAPAGLRFTSTLTLEAWVFPTGRSPGSTPEGVIVGKEGEYLLGRLANGTLGWALAGTSPGWVWVSSGFTLPDSQWTHVAVSYDGTRVQTFANGHLVSTVVRSGPIGDAIPDQNDFAIGSRSAANQHFSGFIDEVRVWSIARSEHQIREDRHRLLRGNETGLAGYWPLDDGTGDTASDHSPNAHPGTGAGGRWVTSFAPVGVPQVSSGTISEISLHSALATGRVAMGDLPAAAYFEWDTGITGLALDGADDAVVVPHIDPMNGDPANGPFLTATAWVRAPAGTSGGLVNKYLSGSLNGWQMYLFNGELRAWYFVSGSRHVWGNTVWTDGRGLNAGRIADNTWHHAAFQVDTSGGYLYVDGTLRASLRWTGAAGRTTTTQPLSLGRYAGESGAGRQFLTGEISDVALWRTDLPVNAIQDILTGRNYYPDYLVGWWRLDEGAGTLAADSSGQGNHGVLVGDPVWVPSARPPAQFSYRSAPSPLVNDLPSLVLDDPADHGVSSADIDLAGESFSIEFWARRDQTGGAHMALGQTRGISQSSAFQNRGLHIGWRPNDTFTFAFFFNDLDTPDPWRDADWHHWACTYDRPSGARRIYRDGVLVAADQSSGVYQGEGPIRIGLREFAPTDDWAFPGALRDVRIWRAALSPDTLREWKDRPLTNNHPHHASLQANWKLDDAAGDSAPDSGPGRVGLNLIPTPSNGGPQWIREATHDAVLASLSPSTTYVFRAAATNAYGVAYSEPRRFTTHAPGSGTAPRFDGIDDAIRIGPFSELKTTSRLALEAWVFPEGNPTGLEVLLIREGEYGISRLPDGTLQVALANTAPGWRWSATPAKAPRDQWTHFAVTYDGTQVRALTNGVLAGVISASGPIGDTQPTVETLDLAGTPLAAAQAFSGALDDVRVWSVARSDTEIARDFNVRLAGDELGLVGHYRFDEGTGTDATDATPRRLDGFLRRDTRWMASGAGVGRPQVTTLPATDVAFGRPRLQGEIKTDGRPVQAYFEWGPGELTAPSAISNRVDFFFASTAVARLSDIPWNTEPDLSDSFYSINIPSTTGTFWSGVPSDRFGARFRGFLDLPVAGTYLFHLTSDDGSDLWIDGQRVVDHDGLHGPTERSGAARLDAGLHSFEARMFDNTGGAGLILSYQGPGIAKQVIPPNAFTSRPPRYASTTDRQSIGGLPLPQPVSAELPALLAEGTYQYRLVVEYPDGTVHGGNQTFHITRAAAGTAVRFDGVDDYLQVGSDPSTKATTALTVEAWILPLGPGAGGMIVNREGEYEVARLPSGELWWAISNGGRWRVNLTGAIAPIGQWTHVALVFDAGTVRFHVNGVPVATSSGTGVIGDAHTDLNDLRIGNRQLNNSPFDGIIDDVRVWTVARSETDIRNNRHRWLAGTETGLKLYLRLNEGADLFSDNLAGSPDATLVNGPLWTVSDLDQQIPPPLDTTNARPVLATSAALNGWVNPAGSETVAWFTWWPTDNPSDVRRTANRAVGSGQSQRALSEMLTGLTPDQAYEFRLHATSAWGSSASSVRSFRTLLLDCGWPVGLAMTDGWSRGSVHTAAPDGHVIVAGLFSGTATFGTISLSAPASASDPEQPRAAFIARLDAAGDWKWAKAFDATSELETTALAVADDGSVRLAGWFAGVLSTGESRLASGGATAGFVLAWTADGDPVFASAVQGAGSSRWLDLDVATDGSTIAAGSFDGILQAPDAPLVSAGSEDGLLARLSPTGEWQWIHAFGGPGTDRAHAVTVSATNLIFLAGEFSGTARFGATTLTSAGQADVFLARTDPAGAMVWAARAGGTGDDRAADLAHDSAGNLVVTGNARGVITYAGSTLNPGASAQDNLFVARLDSDGGLDWFSQTGVARSSRLALDATGDAYVIAEFSNNLIFQTSAAGTLSLVPVNGSRDVVVAKLAGATGSWIWARQLGSDAAEAADDLSVGRDGMLTLGGSFSAPMAVGEVNLITSRERVFLARMNPNGGFEYNAWTIGRPIAVPAAAQRPDGGAFQLPRITLRTPAGASWGDYFFWSQSENLLFPIRPADLAEIAWALSADLEPRTLSCLGRTVWPVEPTLHTVGAPVDLEPAVAGFPLRFQEIEYSANAAVISNLVSQTGVPRPVFHAPAPGRSVLRFLVTSGAPIDITTQPTRFEVIESRLWDDPLIFAGDEPARIGLALTNVLHADPAGRGGYVVHSRAPVDMIGDRPAHQRAERLGPIVAVNTSTPDPGDDLVVAWYRTNTHAATGIAWPSRVIRYLPEWPTDAETLVIASGLGSGPLPVAEFPEKHVYRQADPLQAGHNPNEEHALLVGDVLYALRNDLNAITRASEPFVLLKYRAAGQWAFKLWRVVAEDTAHPFVYGGRLAGSELLPPSPLPELGLCDASRGVSGPYFEDHAGRLYARAAGPNGAEASLVLQFFYPLQEGFDFDLDLNGQPDAQPGDCVAWLDRLPGGSAGTPVSLAYHVRWPDNVPTLRVGESLYDAKAGVFPAIKDFASAAIVFDEGDPLATNAANSIVRLVDPLSERTVQLPPGFALPPEIATANHRGRLVFSALPFSLRARLFYDPLNRRLSFGGYTEESVTGDPLLLFNVLTPRERDRILALSTSSAFRQAVGDLFDLTRNPARLDTNGDGAADRALLIGLTASTLNPSTGLRTGHTVHESLGDLPKVLTAGVGNGTGYITVVENDDPTLAGLPVTLRVLRVEGGPYRGEVKVIAPDNVFDERLMLRHSADFAGAPERLEFEWYYHPDDGFDPTRLPVLTETTSELNGWTRLPAGAGGGPGGHEVLLGDAGASGLLTLADHWFIVRYRGYAIDGATPWSPWAGAPGGDRGQLAEGWVKRVIDGLNPFEARTRDFHASETVTYASMLQQAGRRYEGDIPFNPDAGSINNVGLIEAYETVLRRGKRLSIDAAPPVSHGPANDALLLAAGRIADLYMLLGNEAFADAADPTIGFPTTGSEYGSLASSIFAFQNQLDSLLDEELALLRGRDPQSASVGAAPAYNRLFWNFTRSDGEVAYSQTYNITDVTGPAGSPDGLIDERDARSLFPQGHGDAWGHYLTAISTYYQLLQDPDFAWIPRTESILLGGSPVEIDYLDERKFARAASFKARTGAEIVDLTYRRNFVDDPAGQWQGYQDTDPDRAWGVTDWARRAGQGAYFDWVTANAVLPAQDPDPTHTGIRRIDRTTVTEIDEIVAAYTQIQVHLDKADIGLNPLGLAKGVVPFDIDPARIDQGQTHFEQLHDRAVAAMQNAVTVFNHASQLTQSLRRNQDQQNAFTRNTAMQERDYKNRLIELMGYPYPGDIGPGGTYPSGYDGPDLYHYMYVDATDLNGDTSTPSSSFTGFYRARVYGDQTLSHFFPDDIPSGSVLSGTNALAVNYPLSASDFGTVPPASWGIRQQPGEIQLALSSLLQQEAALRKALASYDLLINGIQDQVQLLQLRYALDQENIRLTNTRQGVEWSMEGIITAARATQRWAKKSIDTTRRLGQIAVEGVPRVVGLANDVSAPLRASLLLNAEILAAPALTVEGIAASVEAAATLAKEATIAATESQIESGNARYEVQQQLKVLEQQVREEAPLRLEIYTLRETVQQAAGEYLALVGRALRLIEERAAFRRNAAAETQASRYQDMSFRIFRNDALQKYRAQFDLAQRYVFLAATAYDFETQTLVAGNPLLTGIIRERSLGQLINGRPQTGQGLANTLAVLNQNFSVLKGRLGFNNPQSETGQFSLRREFLRISDNDTATWRAELRRRVVPDLWSLPEFRRYCRIFAGEADGPQPGIVIRFPTTITSGLNFFGWPLTQGDTAYDTTLFSTKVRSVGVWFSNYQAAGLASAPRVYLIPAGADVVRTPASDSLATREWRIIDQKLPVPFPLGAGDLANPSWIPVQDSFGNLGDAFGDIQKFSSFRAYHDNGFSQTQVLSSDRLVGRSVWNTDWILILRGATFLNDPDEGLDRFIAAVSDIKVFFQTYSFSGN